jgi:hypothetical protein
MQTLLRLLLTPVILFLPLFISGQELAVNKHKLNDFTVAIAHAEGFGPRRTLPTRYHNPGDLKCHPRKPGYHFKGVRRIGKGGHAIFKSDAAGWAALRTQVILILGGNSRNFNKDMTINQMAQMYARNWRHWAANVANELGVSPDATLAEYFDLPMEPPTLSFPTVFPAFLGN